MNFKGFRIFLSFSFNFMEFFLILPFYLFFRKKNNYLELLFSLGLFGFYFILKSFETVRLFGELKVFSWSLIILSLMICIFIIFGNFIFLFLEFSLNFTLMVFFMFFSLYIVFFSTNLFVFYVFFEFSVLPIFFIICGLGFRFERLESAVYIFVYTLFFSLPFIIFLFLISSSLRDFSFFTFNFIYFSNWDYFFVFFSVLMFFVKIPSFFLHLWLPKAHVEAPVSGSIILAGVLLKLGAYGLYILFPMLFFQIISFSEIFFIWGLWGSLIASFCCFYQVDLKKIIAYISIIHIGIVISRLFTFLDFSFLGVLIMLLGHGFVSSALFYCLNIFYERFFSRSIFIIRGGVNLMPSLFLWFSLVISFNISVPPSMNFISELFLIFSMASFFQFNLLILVLCIFLNSLVSFYLLTSIFHGFSALKYTFDLINLKEMFLVFGHLLPLVWFLLFI